MFYSLPLKGRVREGCLGIIQKQQYPANSETISQKRKRNFGIILGIKVPRRKQRGITARTPISCRGKPRGIKPFLAPRLAKCFLKETLCLACIANKNLGEKFRRQQPIGPYFPDFVCLNKFLIVGLDGGQHFDSADDKARDDFFKNKKFMVLRLEQ